MKMAIKKLLCVTSIITSMAICLSGCGANSVGQSDSSFRFKVKGEEMSSAAVAENGEYSLYWDSERTAVMLLENGQAVLGSIPADEYNEHALEGRVLQNLTAPVVIEYVDNDTKKAEKLNSLSECLENGRIRCEEIKNGLRVYYCFDSVNIVIPVDYKLCDGYIEVSIATKLIRESNTKLYSISLMNGLVSCKNSEENYLFLPDGSGAIYSCSPIAAENEYWIPMYGGDPSSIDLVKYRNTASAHLPVFGAKSGNTAICAIITGGRECAQINGTTSAAGSGYSNAYVTFVLRGKTEVSISGVWGRAVVIPTYSDQMTVSQTLSVRYYPLEGEKSAYMQMADCYREYLTDKYKLKPLNNDKQLYLNIAMAGTLKKFYFGIPSQKTASITTYDQTKEILEDIGDINLAVRLDGITRGGIEIGKYAGDFEFELKLGSKKQLSSLLKYAREKGIALYPNFDLVRYRKGISGYNMASYSASSAKSLQYFYNIAKGSRDTSSYIYYLINPLLHITASNRAVAAAQENGFEGISLATLSNTCYSDYRQKSTYVARGFANRVNGIFKSAGKKMAVMGEGAHDYSAVMCDDIIASPTSTSGYNGETYSVPFYQIVFKGYVPLSGQAVNLSNEPHVELLYNASLGIGSLYSVANDDTTSFNLSFQTQLSGGSYWQQNDDVKAAVADNSKAYEAAKNQTIEDYEFLKKDVTKTTFSNGKSIIANFTDTEFMYGDVPIAAGGYIVTEGGAE